MLWVKSKGNSLWWVRGTHCDGSGGSHCDGSGGSHCDGSGGPTVMGQGVSLWWVRGPTVMGQGELTVMGQGGLTVMGQGELTVMGQGVSLWWVRGSHCDGSGGTHCDGMRANTRCSMSVSCSASWVAENFSKLRGSTSAGCKRKKKQIKGLHIYIHILSFIKSVKPAKPQQLYWK